MMQRTSKCDRRTCLAAVFSVFTYLPSDRAATASGSGVSLTVTNGAYTSGGTVYINTNMRSGTGFLFNIARQWLGYERARGPVNLPSFKGEDR
jgi:hypothetical protein